MPAKKKTASKKLEFKANDFIVYPAHGVGKITGVEKQGVAGHKLELFVINFEKEKMTLRVPVEKVKSVGMRRLAADDVVGQAIKTLKGRARVKRTMWSRRAQEYEAKINSGDIIAIAEVVRDLYRSDKQPEQSYSERQLYEQALERMAREVAAVEKSTDDEAVTKIEGVLEKAPSRNKPEKEEGTAEAGDANADAKTTEKPDAKAGAKAGTKGGEKAA